MGVLVGGFLCAPKSNEMVKNAKLFYETLDKSPKSWDN